MRKIKFRGKSIDTGEWVYGNYQYHYWIDKEKKWVDTESYKGWSPPVHDVKKEMHFIIPFNSNVEIRVDPETVGQFTGLKDENGKEVYEGDKVRGSSPSDGVPRELVVSWEDTCWYPLHYWDEFEVIGNKFDNPELLKTK